jgi:2-polyprenyl-3-methyl-5-hydroxy-6-metoxy-1,4-benzoquinol methylase
MLARCAAEKQRRGLDHIEFVQGALPLACPAAIERADLVLCSSVLEYVPDWNAVLPGIRDLLTPGGHFLVSLPNGRSLYRHYEQWKYRLTGQPPATSNFCRGLRATTHMHTLALVPA